MVTVAPSQACGDRVLVEALHTPGVISRKMAMKKEGIIVGEANILAIIEKNREEE